MSQGLRKAGCRNDSFPCKGPVSNARSSNSSLGLMDSGTRTEALQNVPHANPLWAVPNILPSALTADVWHCGPDQGDVSLRWTELTSSRVSVQS